MGDLAGGLELVVKALDGLAIDGNLGMLQKLLAEGLAKWHLGHSIVADPFCVCQMIIINKSRVKSGRKFDRPRLAHYPFTSTLK
jgi:hypothetical protein